MSEQTHKAGRVEWCHDEDAYRIEFDRDIWGFSHTVMVNGPESLGDLIAAAPELKAENARLNKFAGEVRHQLNMLGERTGVASCVEALDGIESALRDAEGGGA